MDIKQIFREVIVECRQEYERSKAIFPYEKEENRVEFVVDYVIDKIDETKMNHQYKRLFLDSLILELELARKYGAANETYSQDLIDYLIFYIERRKSDYENWLFLSIAK